MMGDTNLLHFEHSNEYGLEVAKGMDPIAVICFAIAVDEINEEKKKH